MSYLVDKRGSDPEIEALERSLSELAYKAPLGPLPERRPQRGGWRWWLAGGGLIAAAAAVALFVALRGGAIGGAVEPVLACSADSGGWPLVATGGAPRCGGVPLPDGARLAPGRWLETDATSTAKLAVADIGALEVAPWSRLAIRRTGPDEHRLLLDRGAITATVDAPPRLFVVDTPGGTAVDLGCAYTMAVADDGAIHLAVTEGEVSFERGGAAALVPAGYQLWVDPRIGPSLPVALDAGAAATALARDPARRGELIERAGASDTLALWHLLGGDHCAAAREKLLEVAPLGADLMRRYTCAAPGDLVAGWREVLRPTW